VDLPGAERGTDEDADAASDQEPDEEVPTSSGRHDREHVHTREGAPKGIAMR
jgi:hypothetical protein